MTARPVVRTSTTAAPQVPSEAEELAREKQQAADSAVAYVQSGMVVGLGAGSTAILATRRIGQLLREGRLRDIVGVPCSSAIEAEARALGIPVPLDPPDMVDLTIDGADEVDPELNLIKGGGGALLHEKIVAQASLREVIIVDESKLSPALGTHWALPVEVIPFGWHSQRRFLESLGARITVRPQRDGTPFRTDQGNLILDCAFGPIRQPATLAAKLDARTGIVEHGLFLGLATEVIVAGAGRHPAFDTKEERGMTQEPQQDIDQLCINTLRTLAMDAVEKAHSGHPGAPMALAPVAYQLWQQELRYDPAFPIWPNRDRFILSNGHASMLLYGLLHLGRRPSRVIPRLPCGSGQPSVSMEDIQRFRQLDSQSPRATPSTGWTTGVVFRRRPAGPGRLQQRGHGDRRPVAWGHLQPPGLHPVRLRRVCPVWRWRHDGGPGQRGRLHRRAPAAAQPVLYLRRQPHLHQQTART